MSWVISVSASVSWAGLLGHTSPFLSHPDREVRVTTHVSPGGNGDSEEGVHLPGPPVPGGASDAGML